jgi:NADPH:quinone reductase
MRALVADGHGGLGIGQAPEPSRSRQEAIIEVHATSLNRGELTRVTSAAGGWRPGWDCAGVVVEPGADGPPAGVRVVGIAAGGAWAERVAAPAGWLAELPPELSFATAAALPTAGLTALRMLRLGTCTLGRRVLVTGAAGGVGRYAVQLAHLGGAHVTAIVGRPERARGLRELGADQVVTGTSDPAGRFDLILESAGGESLARHATMLDPDGTLVIFGNSSNQPTVFSDIRDVYLGGARRLQSFDVFHSCTVEEPNRDLAYLCELVMRRILDPGINAEVAWTEVGTALERLRNREVHGKIVLTLR